MSMVTSPVIVQLARDLALEKVNLLDTETAGSAAVGLFWLQVEVVKLVTITADKLSIRIILNIRLSFPA